MMKPIAGTDPFSHRHDYLHNQAASVVGQYEVLIHGHFDFRNGFHGTEYLNPHALTRIPSVVLQLGQLLVDKLPLPMKRADVVCGPFTGGAFLAFVLAGLLDSHFEGRKPLRELDQPPKVFVPIKWHEDLHDWVLTEYYTKLVDGRSVLIADDVRNTGQTLTLIQEKIESYGGKVVGTCSIFERSERMLPLPLDHVSLHQFSMTNYLPENCPRCKSSDPEIRKFTKF